MSKDLMDEQLIAYVSGELPESDAAVVERSLAGDAERTSLVDALRTITAAIAADDVEVPRAEVVQRGVALFKRPEQSRRGPGWAESLQAVLATLVFDSRTGLAPAGFRGGGVGSHVAFENERGRLDVSLTRLDPGSSLPWRVRGQFRGTAGSRAGRIAVIGKDEPRVLEAQADEHGCFVMDVREGQHALVVELDDVHAFAVDELEIG